MIIDLKTARYKGVEFLFTDMPTTGGNRLIKYNFPGSDKQAIERQGKAPRTFTITAIIPHENYYQQRDELLRVLEDGERGVLVHPTFGDIDNVINGRYTFIEKITELGRSEIVIPFEVDDAPGIPQQSGNLTSQLLNLNENLISQIETDFASSYKVDLSFSGNFIDASENLNNVADSMENAITQGAEDISDSKLAIDTFRDQIGNLITDPDTLATEISGLFENINNLFQEPQLLINAFESLFNFGNDDPIIKLNTVGRIQRNTNRELMRVNIKSQSLGYAYVSASQIEYLTTDELDQTRGTLENQYLSIRNSQLLTEEAEENLERLRIQTQKIFDAVRVNTRSIITINTRLIPLSVLVYNYYGSTELVDIIADLNNIKMNAFVEGDIRILTT